MTLLFPVLLAVVALLFYIYNTVEGQREFAVAWAVLLLIDVALIFLKVVGN